MSSAGGGVESLAELPARVQRWPAMGDVLAALARGESGTIDGAWGSACALLCGTIARTAPACLLVVLPRISDVDDFAADLAWYLAAPPVVLSAWDGRPGERSIADAVFSARLNVLQLLASDASPRVIVTSLAALLQPVPARAERAQATRRIARGESLDVDELLAWLVARGFERSSAIERPGEFSVHGGIVDIFAPGAEDPVRIELFGDEVESLRSFDVESQRKVAELESTELTALAPASAETAANEESFLESLPAGSWVALVEPEELTFEGEHYLQRLGSPEGLYSVAEVLAKCTSRPSVTIAAVSGGSFDATAHLQIESVERFSGRKSEAFRELESVLAPGESVLIACHNLAERERLHELLLQTAPQLRERTRLTVGGVTHGYRLVPDKLVVLSDHELFGRVDIRRAARRRRPEGRAIDSFLDLSPGDLVVHLAHGIGRFRGLELVKRGTGAGGMNAPAAFRNKEDETPALEEHLVLEFRDGVRIFVPVSLIHLVQKYVGPAKGTPDLSKIGGTLWGKQKARVTEAVTDMAADMLRLQAVRHARPGVPCGDDTHLQQEFEASFPYVETDDQLSAIQETKGDLERAEPMDRLICGDVGFGKTEVALRAAFKVVDNGRQVAVLVPTTVLADQHFRTFCDRLAEYPITIDMVSRFRTKHEQREILKNLETGGVDILIGTHRLVSPDVKFHDLGLLIIDEEQRFGVAAKEALKHMRLTVDVLTLSATPIPRTLHMSLLGIRDISNLTTPPPDRQPIETRIGRWDVETIRHAVVRELNRGGQVYFVHNRVYNIRTIADRIQSIVPEARIGIVHGQMAEHELEDNMLAFVAGKMDILVATTIIESGLDIPNANTIFIHQADKYGLADLHQLRGRVGRYKHRAYCYLIVEEGRVLTRPAAKRLKAIQEFSELGAGFKIAMRDLEIRGAGNILGTEQSGHIAAVGYELYCQLLENSVRQLKGEAPRITPHVHIDLPIEAYLPNDYVPPGRQKLDVYRSISAVATLEELARVDEELRDRFGPVPEVAQNAIALRELELLAFAWKITTVRLEEGYAVFDYSDAARIRSLAGRHPKVLRVVDSRAAFLVLPNPPQLGRPLVEHLKSVLR
ncbi:MAG: transcription-repair coupling factor [Planctomycetaceae bacterium]